MRNGKNISKSKQRLTTVNGITDDRVNRNLTNDESKTEQFLMIELSLDRLGRMNAGKGSFL